MNSLLTIASGQCSIAGKKERNEDACGVKVPEQALLISKGITAVIADGMSGCEAGHEASAACAQGFLTDYYSTPDSWSVKSSAQKVLTALNHWLYGNGQRNYGTAKGLVTTFSGLVIKSTTAYLVHIGDSRIYRLRDGDLEPLTTDHKVQIGPNKSYLNRAMGIDVHLDIDFRSLAVDVGDLFLMTTDGVHEFLNDAALKKQLLENKQDLNRACENIVQQALDNGSDDNLTCQLVRIEHLPDKSEQEFYRHLIELPFPPSLQAGMILDGYKVLRELSANKRTEVFLVEDTQTKKEFVLKAPSVNYADDADYINQFLHEEWAGKRINNPHVVKVYETDRQRQCLYSVIEYIPGQNLRQWMNDNPAPSLTKVRNFAEQISKGLRAFHRMEMIHQDIKPENIIIDEHGTIKIIDFGSTKIAGIEEISTPLANDNLLGTVNYTAPEYHRGENASNRSDIFSLGVIVYELLTGQLPYDKELNPRTLKLVRYNPARLHDPELPVWLDKTLEKAVNLDPQWRYEKLSEFVYDLSHPNPDYLKDEALPLLERNPLGFWRGLSIALLLINLYLIYLLSE